MKHILLPILVFCLAANTILAQDTDTTQHRRPRIGLVLSGGGAKGLAHIGVLKAIDSAGLNIDYITGTSMGAILAGMYAAGYNGHDIERIAGEMDWSAAMSSSVDYRNVSIETKDQYERYLLEMPVHGFRVSPATGFVEPQELMLKFSEVFYPVYNVKDFSKLTIPFKCIATDIGNGEAVVLDRGDISHAVRSSMAIPGVFTATERNNTKLVDGGIVRNFPVQNVREMGADFVIGVNLFSGLSAAGDINNMLDVMLQVMNFSDAKDLVFEKSLCDMIIEPQVSQFSSTSFSAHKQILAIGDSIGAEFYPLFKQLADSLFNAYGVDYASPNRMRPYPEKVRITGFAFDGLKNTSESLFLHNINLQVGESYSPLELNAAFRRAYASQYYKNLSYELLPDTLGQPNDAMLKCNIDEHSLTMLKVGLSYNTFSNAALILNLTRKHKFSYSSSLDIKMAISESLQFLVRDRFFFGKNYNYNFDARYRFSRYRLSIFGYQTTKKDYIYTYHRNDFALSIGHVHSPRHSTDFTLGFEAFNLSPEFASPTQLDGSIRNLYATFSDHYNTLDRKYLPTRGMSLRSSIYLGYRPRYKLKENYNNSGVQLNKYDSESLVRLSLEGDFFASPTDRLTLITGYGIAASYNAQTLVHSTALGGPQRFMPSHFSFYGLATASKFAPTLALGRAGVQYRLMGDLYLSLHANAAATFNGIESYIADDEQLKPVETLLGCGLTVSYYIARMPFDITLMNSQHYGFNIAVNVGFPF